MKFIILLAVICILINAQNTIATSRFMSRTTALKDWSIIQDITDKSTRELTFELGNSNSKISYFFLKLFYIHISYSPNIIIIIISFVS
jgi:hypothetical protein